MYLLSVTIQPDTNNQEGFKNDLNKFSANLEVSMRGPHGFLSATNWPLLPVICFDCEMLTTIFEIINIFSFMGSCVLCTFALALFGWFYYLCNGEIYFKYNFGLELLFF